jgi:hypothetical protein
MLVTLVIGGILLASQLRANGPTAPAVTRAETQAQNDVAGINFAGADNAMRASFALNGTYAGATLDPSFMVTLVRADATSYCLQTTAGSAVEHEVGPNGTPQPGPC